MGSSSSSRNETTNVTNVADERVAADGEAQVFRAGGDVTVTDGGAIDLAGTLAQDAFEAAEGVGNLSSAITLRSLDLAEDSLNRVNDAYEGFTARSGSEQAQFFEQIVKYAVPAIALIFIARSYFK